MVRRGGLRSEMAATRSIRSPMRVSSPPSTYELPSSPLSWASRMPAATSSTCTRFIPSSGNTFARSLPLAACSIMVTDARVVAGAVDAARLDDHDRRALRDPLVARARASGTWSRRSRRRSRRTRRGVYDLVDHLAARVAEDVDRRDVDDPLDAGLNAPRRARARCHLRWPPASPAARTSGCRPRRRRRCGSRRRSPPARGGLPRYRRESPSTSSAPSPGRLLGRAHEGDHLVATLAQRRRHVPADETRTTSEKRLHGRSLHSERVQRGRNGRTSQTQAEGKEGIRNPRARQRAFCLGGRPRRARPRRADASCCAPRASPWPAS